MGTEYLNKSFGNRKIYLDTSIEFPKNKISFIMAPNGAGKTTFIQLLSDLIPVNSGNIINPYLHRDSFILFDDLSLYENISGLDNIKIFTNFQFSTTEIENYAEQYFPVSRLKNKVKSYSLGEGKKLSLIIWELMDPSLTIMDEITNGLDYKSLKNLQQKLVDNKNKSKDNFTILTGHHFEFYEKIIDNLFIINDQKIVEYSDWKKNRIEDIYEEYFSTGNMVSDKK